MCYHYTIGQFIKKDRSTLLRYTLADFTARLKIGGLIHVSLTTIISSRLHLPSRLLCPHFRQENLCLLLVSFETGFEIERRQRDSNPHPRSLWVLTIFKTVPLPIRVIPPDRTIHHIRTVPMSSPRLSYLYTSTKRKNLVSARR